MPPGAIVAFHVILVPDINVMTYLLTYFGADYVKVVKVRRYSLQQKCSPKNLVFSDISFMETFTEVAENERSVERHLRDIHPLLDYDASESQV